MSTSPNKNPQTSAADQYTKPPTDDPFAHEQEGFHKGLGARQLQMIAIGSAIGTGLFLGTGSRLQDAGPMLAVIYAVIGFFGYLILRALGEPDSFTAPPRAPSSPTPANSTAKRPHSYPDGCTG